MTRFRSRYLHWLNAMLHGDWGFSFVSRVNVDTLILQRLPTTLGVIGASQILALLIALPVGVFAATRPYSIFDQIASTFALIGFSLPTFFTGIVLILLFSVELNWLPFVFSSDVQATGLAWWWEEIRQSIMPVAGARTVPGRHLDALRALRRARRDPDGLRHHRARQRTAGERRGAQAHRAQRMIPVVTLIALQMPIVFGGAIMTEQIFRVPGVGSLLISAILANDTPVIMAVTFVFACLVILFNLIADLLYGWLDPRISYR